MTSKDHDWESEPATSKQRWLINNDLGAYLLDLDPQYEFPWETFAGMDLNKKEASNLIDWLSKYTASDGKEPDVYLDIPTIEHIARFGNIK